MMNSPDKQRLLDLLSERAVLGLNDAEEAELNSLLTHYPEYETPDFELAAAAMALTDVTHDEPLPGHLRDKILAAATQYVGGADPAFRSERDSGNASISPAAKVIPFWRRKEWAAAGWYLAAASLLLAVGVSFWPRSVATTPSTAKTIVEQRRELLNASTSVRELVWTPVQNAGAANVTGDVVWNTATQRGFMRFRGLPVNDAKLNVYQLWIFDRDRDERFPVDGGVFNITVANGEAIVPIQAKLFVHAPTLFAVTIEQPGGVVVSKRDRLILVAKVPEQQAVLVTPSFHG